MDQLELRELEKKCTQDSPPACVAACPLHVEARELMIAIQKDDGKTISKLLTKRQPFPGIISRVCEQPCLTACIRKDLGGSLAIGALERYCVTHYSISPSRPKVAPKKQQRVAVIGGGISGLTAAWELAKKGYKMVVFEQEEKLGGRLLALEERILPREVLNEELANLNSYGVQVRNNTRIGSDLSFMQVCQDFDAVYIASGLRSSVPEKLINEEGRLVVDPQTFATSISGVFAGGSLRSGEESFIQAAADGKRAAVSIDRFLQKVSLSAGRDLEGEFATDLYVKTQGIPSIFPVAHTHFANGFSREEAMAEASRCLDCQCLECVKGCKYLEEYGGYPKKYIREIYNNESIVMGLHHANKFINSCTLCGQCAEVCPNHLDLGKVVRAARERMVQRGKMPPSAHDFALEDMKFSNSELFALAKHQPGRESSQYVFFPGCQLSATSPERVEQVYGYLQNQFSEGVGLMLRCCGAPAEWAGRQDLALQAEEQMREEWERMGRPILITACSTCYETFKTKYPEVVSLWGILQNIGLPQAKALGQKLAIHDACTTRHETQIHQDVRNILQQLGCEVEELPFNRETTTCCGYGGLMWSANHDLSRKVAAERTSESAKDYVVYCAMCRDRFADQGKHTVHLLDLIFSEDPMREAGKRGPRFSERHSNRIRLKNTLLREMWQEVTEKESSYMSIHLILSDEIKALLEDRRILLEDVQKVIEQAENTGRKFKNPVNGHVLAYFKPANVTYWVEYRTEEDGFIVYNAYSHRMEIVEDVKG